jgi:hypothetical protein
MPKITNRLPVPVLSIVAALCLLPAQAAARPHAPNGCGTTSTAWVPELHFTPACNRHDICYSTPGVVRRDCDRRFLYDMRAICDARWDRISCRMLADLYYAAVRILGRWAFEIDQRRAYV